MSRIYLQFCKISVNSIVEYYWRLDTWEVSYGLNAVNCYCEATNMQDTAFWLNAEISPADTRAFSAEPCNEEATFVYYTFMLYTYFPSQNHLLTRCQHRGTIFTAWWIYMLEIFVFSCVKSITENIWSIQYSPTAKTAYFWVDLCS